MLSATLRELKNSLDDVRHGRCAIDDISLIALCGVLLICISDAERLEAAVSRTMAPPVRSGVPLCLVSSIPDEDVEGGEVA